MHSGIQLLVYKQTLSNTAASARTLPPAEADTALNAEPALIYVLTQLRDCFQFAGLFYELVATVLVRKALAQYVVWERLIHRYPYRDCRQPSVQYVRPVRQLHVTVVHVKAHVRLRAQPVVVPLTHGVLKGHVDYARGVFLTPVPVRKVVTPVDAFV